MKTTGNTILITGGGSGIGFETAKLFAANNNRVIIIGRNKNKLAKAAEEIPGAVTIECDITNEKSVDELVERLNREFPYLNILMNNAGKATIYSLGENENAFLNASEEMQVNFLSAIRLTEKLLPLLKNKKEAAIINNSSVAAFAPAFRLPTYSASKAALHSYTQSLRHVLQQTSNIKVFEVLPPLVDTDFAKELPGNKIPPQTVAQAIIDAVEKDEYEIHVAGAADLFRLFLSSPQQAFKVLNGVQ